MSFDRDRLLQLLDEIRGVILADNLNIAATDELILLLQQYQAHSKRQLAKQQLVVAERLAIEAGFGSIREMMAAAEGGVDVQPAVSSRHKVLPKYRDNETGETWSGRGRAPRWMQRKIEAGESADAYLIPAVPSRRRRNKAQ